MQDPQESRQGSPIHDIPSYLDLPSTGSTSDIPVKPKFFRKSNVKAYNCKLPELSSGSIPSVYPEESQTTTAPILKMKPYHFSPAPGVDIHVLHAEYQPATLESPEHPTRIEIMLDITTSGPPVKVDVHAKGEVECMVQVQNYKRYGGLRN